MKVLKFIYSTSILASIILASFSIANDCILGEPIVEVITESANLYEVIVKPVGESSVGSEENPCHVTIAAAANLPSSNIQWIDNLGRFKNDLYPNVVGLRAIKFKMALRDANEPAYKDLRVRHGFGDNYKLIRVHLGR